MKIKVMAVLLFFSFFLSGFSSQHAVQAASTDYKYLSNIVQISIGSTALALDKDGVVWAWGNNGVGQIGDGTTGFKSAAFPILSGVKKVQAGSSASVALKKDGTVWVWGSNEQGFLGDGTTSIPYGLDTRMLEPVKVAALQDVVDIAVNGNAILALKSDGTVWTWGYMVYGALGRKEWKTDKSLAYIPMQVQGLPHIKSIYAGGLAVSAAKGTDGSTWVWGRVIPTDTSFAGIKMSPIKLPNFKIKSIVVSDHFSPVYMTGEDGTLWELQKPLKLKKIAIEINDAACYRTYCTVSKKAGDLMKFYRLHLDSKEPTELILKTNNIKQTYISGLTIFLLKSDGTVHSYGTIGENTGNESFNESEYLKVAGLSAEAMSVPQLRPVLKGITITINGVQTKLSTNPFVIKGTTYIPLRSVFEAMDANVEYTNGSITITNENNSIKMKKGSLDAEVNGQAIKLITAPFLVKGMTMVPLRLISEAFGAEVLWKDKERTIEISTK